ncbi:MAG: hypothetical protein ABIO38_05635 [Luteimonas sp.]
MAHTAVLLPSLAAAQADASQASSLHRQCVASALQVPRTPAGQVDSTRAQSMCTARRARLYAAAYQGVPAEDRPETMRRRIDWDAVDTLETRIRSERIGESQRSH